MLIWTFMYMFLFGLKSTYSHLCTFPDEFFISPYTAHVLHILRKWWHFFPSEYTAQLSTCIPFSWLPLSRKLLLSIFAGKIFFFKDYLRSTCLTNPFVTFPASQMASLIGFLIFVYFFYPLFTRSQITFGHFPAVAPVVQLFISLSETENLKKNFNLNYVQNHSIAFVVSYSPFKCPYCTPSMV